MNKNKFFMYMLSLISVGAVLGMEVSSTKEKTSAATQTIFDNVRAVIFDCDGVLVDSEPLKFRAWQKALADRCVPFSLEEYMPMVGQSTDTMLGLINTVKTVFLPHEVIDERDTEYFRLQHELVVPIHPTVDFARYLGTKKSVYGIKLGLASSAPKHEILVNIKRLGLEGIFDEIVSGEDDLAAYGAKKDVNKPKPYIYQEAAKRLHINPEHCIVFEDSSAGVVAAADAGMNVIAVPYRFTVGQDVSKATMALRSLSELFDISNFFMVRKI